jgi:ATP-dependent Lhr-like helicase
MAFTEPVPRPLEELVARFARTHGPFLSSDVGRRFGVPLERIEGAIAALAADDRLVRGEFRPDGVQREWCDPDVLRQLRRRSLATLRRDRAGRTPGAGASCRPGTASPATIADRRLVEALGVLAGHRSWRRRSSDLLPGAAWPAIAPQRSTKCARR